MAVRTILVTGGAGFIGSAVVREIIQHVLDNLPHYRRTNEARAAGDQNGSHRHTPLVSTINAWVTLSPLTALNSL